MLDELHAAEISPAAIEIIQARNISPLKECRLIDGYTLPYEDGTFDLAILSHVIEHVEYPRAVLYEAGRVARHVFVLVPLEDKFNLPRDFDPNKKNHVNFYNPKTIRRLIQTSELEIVSQVLSTPPYPAYRQTRGTWGAILRYFPKEVMLRVMPQLATYLWCYYSSVLCKKKIG